MALVLVAAMSLVGGLSVGPAAAAQAPVDLGLAAPFAVLGGSTVTNTGPTVLNGDLGLSPGTSVTGFAPGVVNGASHITDTTAANAQGALTTAFNFAAAATPSDSVNYSELSGLTLVPGVYNATSSMDLSGTVTLSGSGVYIFQAGSTLTTATASTVLLTDGASAGCVFWQVGSSATLQGGTLFNGTIMSGASITLVTGANVTGRLLAETSGAVTLDTNDITVPAACGAASTTTTGLINNATLAAPSGTEVAGASFHDTSTVVGASGVATGTVTYSFFTNGVCTGTPLSTDPVTIAGGGAVPNSTTTGALAAGSYSFEATYGGDTTYLGGVSACEPFVVLAAVTTPPVTTPPVTTPPVTTPPVTTPPVTTAPVAPVTSPTGTAGSGSGTSPFAGSGSSTTGSGSSGTPTASPSVVLPVGAPSTGFGGAGPLG
jgi:hypothetical protein